MPAIRSARFAAAATALLVAVAARGESLKYELYELADGGQRKLLAQGTREYSVREVLVIELGIGDLRWREMELPVANGFSAGGSIYRQANLTGFGLWLKDRGSLQGHVARGGFSWDWFDREKGNVYRKLQGGGRVRVTFVPSDKFQEVAAVEVLEDITLRVNNRPWFFFTHTDTHHLVIKKGSVLRFSS